MPTPISIPSDTLASLASHYTAAAEARAVATRADEAITAALIDTLRDSDAYRSLCAAEIKRAAALKIYKAEDATATALHMAARARHEADLREATRALRAARARARRMVLAADELAARAAAEAKHAAAVAQIDFALGGALNEPTVREAARIARVAGDTLRDLSSAACKAQADLRDEADALLKAVDKAATTRYDTPNAAYLRGDEIARRLAREAYAAANPAPTLPAVTEAEAEAADGT